MTNKFEIKIEESNESNKYNLEIKYEDEDSSIIYENLNIDSIKKHLNQTINYWYSVKRGDIDEC